jgi:hypothetical protein
MYRISAPLLPDFPPPPSPPPSQAIHILGAAVSLLTCALLYTWIARPSAHDLEDVRKEAELGTLQAEKMLADVNLALTEAKKDAAAAHAIATEAKNAVAEPRWLPSTKDTEPEPNERRSILECRRYDAATDDGADDDQDEEWRYTVSTASRKGKKPLAICRLRGTLRPPR